MIPCGPLFLVFSMKCLSKLPEQFIVAYLHSGIVLFTKCSVLNVYSVLNTSVSITAQYFVQLLYAMYCIRHILNCGILAPCVTLAYSQHSHILSPGIFRIRGLFKIQQNVDQAYTELYHEALLCDIQAYSEPFRKFGILETQYSSIIASRHIFRTPSYLRKFANIHNTDIFKTKHIFRTLSKI